MFVGETDFETLERVRNVDVPALGKRNPTVPPELVRIISKALSKDVDDRYQWASEMQADLVGFLATPTIDPPWSAELSSRWMREFFAVEMKREQKVLDQQRRVRTRGAGADDAGVDEEQVDAGTGRRVGAAVDSVVDDRRDERAARRAARRQTTITESSPVSGELPAQPTAILNSSMPAPPKRASRRSALIAEGIKAEPTMVFGDGVRSQSQIGVPIGKLAREQSTLMREAPANLPPIRLDSHAPLSPLIQPFPLPASELGARRRGCRRCRRARPWGRWWPRRRRNRHVRRCGAIWCSAWEWPRLSSEGCSVRAPIFARPGHGTLVVMPAGRAGEVVVDGVVRGQLHGNQPLKLKGMTAGDRS